MDFVSKKTLRCLCQRLNFFLDFRAEFIAGFAQVVFLLQTQPEVRRCPKVACQAQGSVRRNGAATMNDRGDAAMRDAYILGESILGDVHFVEKFLAQNVARVRKFKCLFAHWICGLMVVGNFDIEDVACLPAEANPPLFVYAYTVLPLALARECFEAVGRRASQVVKVGGLAKHRELVERTLLNVLRQAPRTLLVPYFLCLGVSKAFDHSATMALFTRCVNNNLRFAEI